MQSLMRLNEYFVRTSEFKARLRTKPLPENDSDDGVHVDPDFDVEIDFDVFKHSANLEYLITLDITVVFPDNDLSPFERIYFEIYGVFSFQKGTEETIIRQYVPLLCLTSLYSIARGIISQTTALSPNGPFFLPLVNMNEVVKNKLDNMNQSADAVPEDEVKGKKTEKISDSEQTSKQKKKRSKSK